MSLTLDIRPKAYEAIERRVWLREQKQAAEEDLLAYIRLMWPVLEPEKELIEGWLLDCVVDVLMAITDGHLTRVCFNLCPGSMKSSLLNVLYPSWLWGPCGLPHMRFLSASYSTSVPTRDNLRFARVINSPLYKQLWGDFRLKREGAEIVENDKTGFKMVTSTGGGTTGHRGDFLLLDDLNNPMDVESDTVRLATNRWVREIMPSRLNDMKKSVIINLQQRTHQQDATGTLIEHGQDYEFISIPMEFDPLRICSVVLRRDDDGNATDTWTDPRALDADGELLEGLTTDARGLPSVRPGSPMALAEGTTCWPELFPEDKVATLKKTMGDYGWSSQFNMIPGVRGGAIIKRDWWRLWSGDYPELGTVIASLDTAIEEREANDWNALTVWGAFPGTEGEPLLLLVAGWKVKCGLADLALKVAQTCRERKVDYLLVERKTRGKDVHDEIVRLYQNSQWETLMVPANGDKASRLRAVGHLFSGDAREDPITKLTVYSGGIVYAPDRDWSDEIIEQVAAFPFGKHDDYVDTVSQALGFVRRNGVILRRAEYDEQELERNKFKKTLRVPYSIGGR